MPETTEQPVSARRYAKGMELYRGGQWLEAATELAALRNLPDATGRMARFYEGMSYRTLGGEALAAGDHDLAGTYFRAAIAAMGREASLPAYLASIFARTGRREDCLRQVEAAAAPGDGQDVAGVLRLAMAQWQAGRRIESQMTLAAGRRKFPAAASLLVQAGLFHAAQDEYEQAKESFLAAARIDETNASAHRYLGLTYAATGALDRAIASFQRAYELAPDDLMLGVQLSLAAKAAGENGCVVRLAPPTPRASRTDELSRLVLEEKDFVESLLALPPSEGDAELFGALLEAVGRALEARPGYADLRLQASRICLRLGRLDEAVRQGRLATQFNPQYAAGLVHLGRLQAQRGRRSEAIRHLKRGIRFGADWADVHCLAGELLAQVGRTAGARKHLRRALDLNKNYTRAADALAALAA